MGKGYVAFLFKCLPKETEWVRSELKEICTCIKEFWSDNDERKAISVSMSPDKVEEFRLWWVGSFGWNPLNRLSEEYTLDFSHTGLNPGSMGKEMLYLLFTSIFKIEPEDIVSHFRVNYMKIIFDVKVW